MGPFVRIVVRYWIGAIGAVLVTTKILPQEAVDYLQNSDTTLTAITVAVTGAGAIGVEALYAYAKKRGWKT